MPTFTVDAEPITIFRIDDEYLFSHYFEREDVFERLQQYYNGDAYRFEVPAGEFDEVSEYLEAEYYEPQVVDDLEPYCVVKEQYTEHADVLRQSVAHWERRGHMFFLMEDETAVAEALEQGATRVEETEFVLGI